MMFCVRNMSFHPLMKEDIYQGYTSCTCLHSMQFLLGYIVQYKVSLMNKVKNCLTMCVIFLRAVSPLFWLLTKKSVFLKMYISLCILIITIFVTLCLLIWMHWGPCNFCFSPCFDTNVSKQSCSTQFFFSFQIAAICR